MKKTFKVVMLPTTKSNLVTNFNNTELKLVSHNPSKDVIYNPQHLYIISDDEIKEGDWFYNPATKEVLQATREMLSWNSDTTQEHKGWKKIIATTDKLGIGEKEIKPGFTMQKRMPIIPESFIQAYIKAYNEGKSITEVDLEMDDKGYYTYNDKYIGIGSNKWNSNLQIKTRPDNTVIIHQSKMYSKDDVWKLLIKYSFDIGLNPIGGPRFDKWIQDNL